MGNAPCEHKQLTNSPNTNGTACTNCTTTPPPIVYPGILVGNMATWCNDGRTMMECMTAGGWTHDQVGPAPDITVGGADVNLEPSTAFWDLLSSATWSD